MKIKNLYYLFFCSLIGISVQAQQSFSGRVSDTIGKALEGANVLAFPKNDNVQITFAISNSEGNYELTLENKTAYEIRVSYIGYQEMVYQYLPENQIKKYDFRLKPATEMLDEVVLNFELPVQVKGDTTTFKVDAFTSGNERKLKDQLKKMPGFEVDRSGRVTFKGKPVNTLLVEDKDFFGGSTKLGIENIPADAIEKVEVIENYTQVGFMKGLSDSDQMAINIKLKEGKKEFLFGDLDAAYDFKKYYNAHAGLFYFSPKHTYAYIGKANNVGERLFSYDEMLRFQGGISSLLSERKSLHNLWDFINDNTRNKSAKSFLNALNINLRLSPKTILSGYVIQQTNHRENQTFSYLQYLQTQATENTESNQKTRNRMLLANLKFDYKPKNNNQWFYNIYTDLSNNLNHSDLVSQQNTAVFNFRNSSDIDNVNLRQYVEWYKRHNWKNTTTAVVNHTFGKSNPENSWFADRLFLAGLLPLQNDTSYELLQNKKIQTNDFDAMLKHYWLPTKRLHLYTTIGNRVLTSRFYSDEMQKMSDGTSYSFGNQDFGNDLDYLLNTLYTGFEIKSRIGKLTNKVGIFVKNYTLNIHQNNQNISQNRTILQPIWEGTYMFWSGFEIDASYTYDADFATADKYAENHSVTSYQSIAKGNTLLKNERFHTINIRYMKTRFTKGAFDIINVYYNRKNDAVRQAVSFSGVNQLSEFVQMPTPETNWRINTSITRRLYFLSFRFSAIARGFEFAQNIDSNTFFSIRNSQDLGLNIRNVRNKKIEASIGYTHRFHQLNGNQKDRYQSQIFTSGLECNISKNIVLRSDYEFTNIIRTNTKNHFNIWKASLFYQKETSPFGFELQGVNLLGNKRIFENSYSDYLIRGQYSVILPRMIIFSLHYKL